MEIAVDTTRGLSLHEPAERCRERASSPQPSPPEEEREKALRQSMREDLSPSPREERAGRGLGRGAVSGFMVPMHAKKRNEAPGSAWAGKRSILELGKGSGPPVKAGESKRQEKLYGTMSKMQFPATIGIRNGRKYLVSILWVRRLGSVPSARVLPAVPRALEPYRLWPCSTAVVALFSRALVCTMLFRSHRVWH